MNRAAVYLRVSSPGQSTENQLSACTQFAESRGWQVVKIFSEEVSGFKDVERPVRDQLLKEARSGAFHHVIVWCLDRWTRRGAEELLKDIVTLANWNVDLHSCQEEFLDAFNLKGELGDIIRKFLLSLFAWEGQQESRKRSERVKAAYHAGRGVDKWGRPRKNVSPEEAAVAYLESGSLREAAKKVGIKHTTISRRIKEGFGLSTVSINSVRAVLEEEGPEVLSQGKKEAK